MSDSQDDNKTGNADAILVEMYNVVRHDLNVSNSMLETIVERFTVKKSDKYDLKKLQGAKSNFIGAISKDNMTFKTLHRGMVIIGARKYTLTVTGTRKDGVVASCSGTVEVKDEDFIDPRDGPADNILLTMFKQINHITLESTDDFTKLFEDYAKLVGVPFDAVARNKERASLKKDLFKTKKLSWKNFIKGLLFLGFLEFDITLNINSKNGKNTSHSRKIILREGDEV